MNLRKEEIKIIVLLETYKQEFVAQIDRSLKEPPYQINSKGNEVNLTMWT